MAEISRRTFTGAVSAAASFAQAAPARRPNIVFICSDQHSGPAMGCAGHTVVRTPNMDRLAAMGVNFRNTYCGSPVCVPGRASLMTGKFASDVNSYCNSTPLGQTQSWGNRLRQTGYYCRASGKLDLTGGVDYGFEETGTTHGHSKSPDITSLFRAPVCHRAGEREQIDGTFKEREDHDAVLARDAAKFVREEGPRLGKPWAIYVGMHMPHPKWVAHKKYESWYSPARMPLPQIPPGYLEKRHNMFRVMAHYKNIANPIPEERVRRARAAYYAMVSEVDEYVGWVLDAVEQSGQLDNTLFIYTSDHGEMLGDHGLWLKNVLLENAARVPLVMAGAGLPRGKTVDTAVAHVDLVSTMLDFAGAEGSGLRGHSLLPMLTGGQSSHPGFAFTESHSEGNCTGSFLIRKGDWKYVYFTGDQPLLFNLKDDPGEFRNLAGQPATAAIQRELHGHLTSLLDPDQVTERAFAEQERRLKAMVARIEPESFYQQLVGRLGTAQARVLTNQCYRKA